MLSLQRDHPSLRRRGEGTAIEHFARIVDSRRWQDVSIQMLTACFDASGKTPSTTTKVRSKSKKNKSKPAPDHRVVAVAGFASQAGVWREFDLRWAAVLKKYKVDVFHAGDFAYSLPPFDIGWKDERKRRDFQSELMEVITHCGLRKFGSVLCTADRDKARAVLGIPLNDSSASPYVLCARSAVEDFLHYATGEGQKDSVKYIFEKGDEEARLREHFDKYGFHDPYFMWKQPVEKKGIAELPFLGLQAAGWLVWEYYLKFDRNLTALFNYGPEGRWGLRTFDDHRKVCGEVKILYASALLQNLAQQAQAAWPNFNKKMVDSIVRLEAAKRDGQSK